MKKTEPVDAGPESPRETQPLHLATAQGVHGSTESEMAQTEIDHGVGELRWDAEQVAPGAQSVDRGVHQLLHVHVRHPHGQRGMAVSGTATRPDRPPPCLHSSSRPAPRQVWQRPRPALTPKSLADNPARFAAGDAANTRRILSNRPEIRRDKAATVGRWHGLIQCDELRHGSRPGHPPPSATSKREVGGFTGHRRQQGGCKEAANETRLARTGHSADTCQATERNLAIDVPDVVNVAARRVIVESFRFTGKGGLRGFRPEPRPRTGPA